MIAGTVHTLGALRRRISARLSPRVVMTAGVVSLFLALGGWAVASPVGASPDEDFHLSSIWCSHGTREGICEPGSTADTRRVPTFLPNAAECYAFKSNVSAACQAEIPTEPPMVETDRGNFTGGYPPVFYWVSGFFVTGDVSTSVILMRLVNAALFLGLGSVLYVLSSPGRRRALIGGFLVTSVPLSLFLIPSINPSSWAIVSAITLLVAVLGFLETQDRRKRIGFGVLAAVSTIMAAGARADSAVYAVLTITVALVLTFRLSNGLRRQLILPAVLAVAAIAVFLTAGQSGAVSPGAQGGAPTMSIGELAKIVFAVPSLWLGALGGWGLGWLDTYMRPFVALGMWSIFITVLVIGSARAGRRRGVAIALVAVAALLIPTYIQYLSGLPVGSDVQPRYVLPLLILLAVTALVRIDGSVFSFSRGGQWAVVAILSLANAVALYDNIRRYVIGVETPGLNLDQNPQWWWSIPFSPMTTWIVGTLAFGLGALILTRELAQPAPTHGEPAAMGDASSDATAPTRRSLPRDGVGPEQVEVRTA